MVKKGEEKKIELRTFIDENYRLITLLGVFGGLTAFFVTLESNIKNPFLSFSSLAIFLLLSLELWLSFPKSENATARLKLFEYFFVILHISLFGYIFEKYKKQIHFFSFFVFLLLYAHILIEIIVKFKLYERVRKITPEYKWYSGLFRAVFSILMVIIVIEFTFLSAHLLKLYLD